MNKKTRIAVSAAAAVMTGICSCTCALADNAISIDMTDYNDEAWSNIAMANDDTVDTGVNIRSSADEDSKVVGYLYRGGAVYVLNKGDTWTEVTSGDVTGYIKNEYLTYGTEAKGLAEHYGTYAAKAAWNDISIFSDESGNASVVGKAQDGDVYKLSGKDGSWLELDTASGENAYVPAEDMSVVMVVDTASEAGKEKTSSEEAFSTIEGGSVNASSAAAVSSSDGTDDQQTLSDSQTVDDSSNAFYSEDTATYDQNADMDGSSYDDDGTYSDGSDGNVSYDNSYSDTSYDQNYDDATWSDESAGYGQSGSDGSYSDTSYADSSYSDASYTDTSYTDASYSDAGSSEGSYSGEPASSYSGDLQSRASSLYSAYLEAQAAADAAVANGASADDIYATAQAATDAYATYVAAQNAADEASWGGTPDTSQSGAVSYDDGASSYTDPDSSSQSDGTDSGSSAGYDGSYEEPVYETEETEPSIEQTVETEAPDTSAGSAPEETTSQVSSSDVELLAALIYCEAGNQPYDGQVAVGAVVMNRVNSSSFPSTIYDVIYQSGQFTPAYSGALSAALANGSGSGYISAAQDAMNGVDPTGGALYFNTSHGSGVQIGAHWFY